MVSEHEIKQWLSEVFTGDQVEVTGDGRHFNAHVVSMRFAGLSRLARHRLVYQALGDKVGGMIHALSLSTLTPEEQTQSQ
jgi:acid stress-induced BolA-like protein IbaG/YrbA